MTGLLNVPPHGQAPGTPIQDNTMAQTGMEEKLKLWVKTINKGEQTRVIGGKKLWRHLPACLEIVETEWRNEGRSSVANWRGWGDGDSKGCRHRDGDRIIEFGRDRSGKDKDTTRIKYT